jgi:hypothetical protein
MLRHCNRQVCRKRQLMTVFSGPMIVAAILAAAGQAQQPATGHGCEPPGPPENAR